MAFEKSWSTVAPTPLTTDGTSLGVITVADTVGFKVKGQAQLSNSSGLHMVVQINQVLSSTTMIVGRPGSSPSGTAGGIASGAVVDVSAFTVALNSVIGFGMQPKNKIKADDIDQAVYEADPTVALRVTNVDPYGNIYGPANPMPVAVEGTISIGSVSIVDDGNTLKVNADGSINVIVESVPSPNSTVISTYNEVVSLAAGGTAIIVSYTVPVASQAVLQRIPFSGENVARYDLLINSIKQDTARTMFGGDLTGEFNFTTGNDSGLLLNAGTLIQVQVYNPRPYPADFESRIQVLVINI